MRRSNLYKFSILLNIILILFLIGYFLVPFANVGILAKTFSPLCYLIDTIQGDNYLPPWCEDVLIPPVPAQNTNNNANANVNANTNVANTNTAIANPAAVKCVTDGGTTEAYATAGGEAAICIFKDNSICEEWAYFRGECKVGQCQKVCQKAGTADEGWYNSCSNELLKLEKCSSVQPAPAVTAQNIEVTNPLVNQQLVSPFKVEGRARVFENQVNVRVKGKDGKVLIQEATIVKSPEVGQWGDFSLDISYDFTLTKEGFVEVYSTSAKDGSEENLVSIPVKF
ncbi:MAG: Gmad2 immunoglobulin-like domain-containing protein [Patescibacteria group bacterium]